MASSGNLKLESGNSSLRALSSSEDIQMNESHWYLWKSMEIKWLSGQITARKSSLREFIWRFMDDIGFFLMFLFFFFLKIHVSGDCCCWCFKTQLAEYFFWEVQCIVCMQELQLTEFKVWKPEGPPVCWHLSISALNARWEVTSQHSHKKIVLPKFVVHGL